MDRAKKSQINIHIHKYSSFRWRYGFPFSFFYPYCKISYRMENTGNMRIGDMIHEGTQHLNNDKEAMMQHYKAQREARQRQRQQAQLKTRLLAVAGLVFVVVLFFSLKGCTGQAPSAEAKGSVISDEKLQPDAPVTVGNVRFKAGYSAETNGRHRNHSSDAITSTYAIVLDPATNTIIA